MGLFKRVMMMLSIPVLAASLFACDFDVEDEGRLPDVDMDYEPGRAPDVDVRGPDVEVEEEQITVPELDVDLPEEDDPNTY